MEITPGPIEPPKRSGCMVALYVVFGLGIFLLVGGGIAIWGFLQTEQGQKIVEVAGQGIEWMSEASQAPGTAELRDAGCEVALVSEMSRAFELIMALVPDEQSKDEVLEKMEGAGNLQDQLLVMCTLPRLSLGDPDCSRFVRTYGEAVPTPPETIFLLVMRQGADEPSCQGIYSTDGALLESLNL